jgi:hypothetical protein
MFYETQDNEETGGIGCLLTVDGYLLRAGANQLVGLIGKIFDTRATKPPREQGASGSGNPSPT